MGIQPEEERILVFPSKLLNMLGEPNGYSRDIQRYIRNILTVEALEFRLRSEVETDPEWKQVIPYIVIVYKDDIFVYQRTNGGNEARLHNKLSLGIGGHININDGSTLDPIKLYTVGLSRELKEEIDIHVEDMEQFYMSGVIYDDSTLIGQVHFGIVHVIKIRQPNIRIKDPNMVPLGFLTKDIVKQRIDEFETWSQFIIKGLIS